MGVNLDLDEAVNALELSPIPEYASLPLIKSQFQVISLIGHGAFGFVIKVKDTCTNKLLALKAISLKKGDTKRQELVIKSGKTELAVLPRLKHPNIVEYKTSFVINGNPIKLEECDDQSIQYLCVLSEFIHGSDLETLLLASEKNEVQIPGYITIKWFIKLLETLSFFHQQGVIHRDLKPDNILIEYKDLKDFDKVNLKITDFGAAVDVNDESEKVGSGHIFYSSVEVLKKLDYDSLCDCWSLAIIFFQVYFGVSTKTYQDKINSLFYDVKNKYSEEFLKRFNKKDMYSNVKFTELLIFLHDQGIFKKEIIDKFLKEDEGIETILKKMICNDIRDRYYSNELVNHKIIITWKYILFEKIDIPKMIKIDLKAVFTLLKAFSGDEGENPKMMLKCLQCLVLVLDRDYEYFNDKNGLQLLFESIVHFMNDNNISYIFFKIIFQLLKIDFNRNFKRISCGLREFYIIEDLKRCVLNREKDTDIPFLLFLLMKNDPSIKYYLCDSLLPLCLLYKSNLNEIIRQIIFILVPVIKNKSHIIKAFNMLTKSDLYLFYKMNISLLLDDDDSKSGDNDKYVRKLFRFVLSNLKSDDERTINHNLMFLLFMIDRYIFYIKDDYLSDKKHTLAYKNDNCENGKIELVLVSERKSCIEKAEDNLSFSCVDPDSDITSILISQSPFTKGVKESGKPPMNKHQHSSKDHCIGYYEISIQDGGSNDSIIFGVKYNNIMRVCVCVTNSDCKVRFYKKDKVINVINYHRQLSASSNSFIGCGITNNHEVFFTFNNQLIHPFIKLNFVGVDTKFFAYIEVSGNDFLSCRANFKAPFHFKFSNIKIDIKMNENLFKLINDEFDKIDFSSVEMINLSCTNKNSIKYKLSSRVRSILENPTDKNFRMIDQDIVDFMYKDNSLNQIYEAYEHYKSMKVKLVIEENTSKYKFINPSVKSIPKSLKERMEKKILVPEKKMVLSLIEKVKRVERELNEANLKLKELEHSGCGWLMKVGGKGRSWKWRYFKCNNITGEFRYYANYPKSPSEKPIKIIKLPKVYEVIPDIKDDKRPFCFGIKTKERTWVFMAANKVERIQWSNYWIKGLNIEILPKSLFKGWLQFLEKEKRNSTMFWALRYFEIDLKRKTLVYYYSNKESQPIGRFDFQGYGLVNLDSNYFDLKHKTNKKKKTYHFKSVNAIEKQKWVNFLQKLKDSNLVRESFIIK